MEHLTSVYGSDVEISQISPLVYLAIKMKNDLARAVNEESIILLQVEYQAVVQVMIQQLARHLNPMYPNKLGDIVYIFDKINRYLYHIAFYIMFY